MATADRAKQFIPFSALKGLQEALRAKEQIPIPRAELSEEHLMELNDIVHRIHEGDLLQIICYHDGCYEKITGRAEKISLPGRYVRIVTRTISFHDIYDIRFI